MHPGPSSATAETAAFQLLSLPHAVLAQHVWPLLSPWGRAQLRATCKELRQLSDGLLEGTMQFHLAAGAPAAQPQHGGACQDVEEWKAKCALLARCVRVQSLLLQMNATLPPDRLQQLATAAAGRITRLHIDLPRYTTDFLGSTLAMVSTLCPALRELHVSISFGSCNQPSVTTLPPLLGLPATLESLSLSIERGNAAHIIWPALAAALGASTQLTRLRSLRVQFELMGQHVDMSPLVPIASHLTHLHVGWDDYMSRGVSGLPQLLAACSTSLTSLALPVSAPAAPDQPNLAQVLTAAPTLQQLEVLREDFDSPAQPPTAADVHALRTHPNMCRLVVRSRKLCEQLAAAALPPGSLQHLGIELRDYPVRSHQKLLQLLSVEALSAGSRLVYGVHTGIPHISLDPTQLDADLLSRLAQALRNSGLGLSPPGFRQAAGGQLPSAAVSTVPGVVDVRVNGTLVQPSDQQAAAGLLSSLPVWHLDLTDHLFSTFRNEAEAAQAGSNAVLWLLPALARVRSLSISYTRGRDELPQFAAALSIAVSHGYLPQLQCLVFWFSIAPDSLVGVAEVLKACCVRPGLHLIISHGLDVTSINKLRAALDAIPAPSSPTTDQPEGAAGSSSTGAAAGAPGQQQSGVTLDDEGRRLLLQHLLC